MKKKFNIIIAIAILVLAFAAVVGQHYFDRMEGPIHAMKQMELNGNLKEDITKLSKWYGISFWVITISQIFSISILFLVIYNSNEQSKKLEKHEEDVKNSEGILKKHEEELLLAQSKLQKAEEIAKRNNVFMNLIQKSNNLDELSTTIINNLSKDLNANQGAFFIVKEDKVKLHSSYAYHIPEGKEVSFEIGEGLVGQVAQEGKSIILNNLPEGHLEIVSGLGSSKKSNLVIIPIKSDEKVLGVIEIGSFNEVTEENIQFIENISQNISTKLSVFLS